MKNFLKLRLPANPVKDQSIIDTVNINGGYNLLLPKQILTDEIMEIFYNMGLKPKYVTLFGRNDFDGSIDTRMIHADVALSKDGNWQKMLFGINWEVTGHHNIFSWWDMSAYEELYPAENLPKKYDYLNGIHYVERGNRGVPPMAVKLEETVIEGPTLVRTELPHMTVYNGPAKSRVGLSVRFFEDDFNTWDDVYNFFEKYSLDE